MKKLSKKAQAKLDAMWEELSPTVHHKFVENIPCDCECKNSMATPSREMCIGCGGLKQIFL